MTKIYDNIENFLLDGLKMSTDIFAHSYYWHEHINCRYSTIPKRRTQRWLNKINDNKQQDDDNNKKLTFAGWKVISIFECSLKKQKR